MPCWVFTHRELAPIAGADVAFVAGDVAPVHAEMVGGRRGSGTSGWSAAATWPRSSPRPGCSTSSCCSIAPVTLGAGRPLFPRPFDLRLEELDRNSAFVCARYAVVRAAATD